MQKVVYAKQVIHNECTKVNPNEVLGSTTSTVKYYLRMLLFHM